jgi:adenylate cyclase, class 2
MEIMKSLLYRLGEYFDLNNNHIKILESLLYENLDAKKICDKTKIPQGRIYDYLNYLIKNRLIEKSLKKPHIYSVKNLNETILMFMKTRIDDMISAQSEIMELMEGSEQYYFERIKDSKKFTQTHLSMISETKKRLNYISLHTSFPYTLYPFDKDMFIKLRKAIVDSRPTITAFDLNSAIISFNTYKEFLESGKEMNVIFEKRSFENHINVIKKLGDAFFNRWKKMILEQFQKYNIRVYVIDEYLPMQIDINEKRVNLSLRHHDLINGISISGQGITELYNTIFEQRLKRSEDVVPLIKREGIKNIKEIELRAKSPKNIEESLEKLKARKFDEYHSIDEYLKFKQDKKRDLIIRIRKSDSDSYLTFKGRDRSKEDTAWSSWDNKISNPDKLKDVFTNNGMIKVVTIDKNRKRYQLNDIEINIDDIKGLGKFIEAEIMSNNIDSSKKRIKGLFKKLGIDEKNIIKKGYVKLILDEK